METRERRKPVRKYTNQTSFAEMVANPLLRNEGEACAVEAALIDIVAVLNSR
jgi:hypothetical protein